MTTIAAKRHVSTFTAARSTQAVPVRRAPGGPGDPVKPPPSPIDSFEPAKVLPPGTPTLNDARVNMALDALKKLYVTANGAITLDMVSTLIRGIAIPRTERIEGAEGVLTPVSAIGAAKTMATIPAERRAFIEQLTTRVGAKDPVLERALIYKAVSARSTQLASSNASVANAALNELNGFANDIRNRSSHELVDFTSVIDLNMYPNVDEGLQQRFWMSCVVTSFQIVKAEADPVYAWKLHGEQMAALDDPNGPIGEEQRRWLEAGGGVAVPRITQNQGMGAGMYPERTINQVLSETTHVQYVRHFVSTPAERKTALDYVAQKLEQGYDVPIVAGPSTNHCMVFTDVRSDASGRWFLMQDPWTGQSSWMKESAMLAGNTTYGTMANSNIWITFDPMTM